MIKKYKESLIMALIFLVVLLIEVVFLYLPKHGVIVYNCSIAEISPDFPIEVREQCRKLNTEKIK